MTRHRPTHWFNFTTETHHWISSIIETHHQNQLRNHRISTPKTQPPSNWSNKKCLRKEKIDYVETKRIERRWRNREERNRETRGRRGKIEKRESEIERIDKRWSVKIGKRESHCSQDVKYFGFIDPNGARF